MAGLSKLPQELMDHIIGHIKRKRDLSSLSKCSRGLYWAVSAALFTRAFNDSAEAKGLNHALSTVLVHAAKNDSQNLMIWVMYSKLALQLRGSFTPMENIDIVQSALLYDAPKMATYLLKQGVNLDESMALYPDLKPLYHAISRPISTSLGALDGPLRTACSYALPRTVGYLLTRGADPNTYSPFGYTALHVAMMRTLPWSRFQDFAPSDEQKTFRDDDAAYSRSQGTHWPIDLGAEHAERALALETAQWDANVAQTVEVLLRFGADHGLPTETAHRHQCSPKCWKSRSCAPLKQRPLHLAAAAGHISVVTLLIKRGASVFHNDEQGNLPVVRAMAQDHEDIVYLLLNEMKKCAKRGRPFNPIVCTDTRSTALHVACRFGFLDMVIGLLERGADVNGLDSLGQTPLHEVLRQEAHDLEDRLVEILHTLVNYRANPDAVDLSGKRARDLGENHRLAGVRGLFQYATYARAEYERLTRGAETEGVHVPPPPDPSWRAGEPEETPVTLKRTSKKAPRWVTKESFPALKVDKPQVKTSGAGSKDANSSSTPQKATEAAQKAKGWLSGAQKPQTTAADSTNSVWNSQKILKPADKTEMAKTIEKTEVEQGKKVKKGGRQKKWVRVSLKD
ncbi:Ankyrin repeat and KH domain-containing protein mask [Trichoderma ghanense]|uniref:Ankyrin repeat and KH domain-containing protein mask n=1 Tax=Trichoderma ghanense TaxID=65468 RepID=A0ABY2H2D2_9HYPO